MRPKMARGTQDSVVFSGINGLDIDGVDPAEERSSGAGVQAPVYSCGDGNC